MNLKSVTDARFFAPPIEGVEPVPIDQETGELIFPEFFTKAQKQKVLSHAVETFPALKRKPKEAEEEAEKPEE